MKSSRHHYSYLPYRKLWGDHHFCCQQRQ